MEDNISLGIQKGLISIDDEKEFIKYSNHTKPRRYANPEEKVPS
jgi:hypothetical protein